MVPGGDGQNVRVIFFNDLYTFKCDKENKLNNIFKEINEINK